MDAPTEEVLLKKFRSLLPEQQAEAIAFIERLAEKQPSGSGIWQRIDALVEKPPPEVVAQLPPDASTNPDHYLYGAPGR